MIYVADETDGLRINEGSTITAYSTMEAAIAGEAANCEGTGVKLVELVPGDFGDCWIKTLGNRHIETRTGPSIQIG